jgi:hypothetical protein
MSISYIVAILCLRQPCVLVKRKIPRAPHCKQCDFLAVVRDKCLTWVLSTFRIVMNTCAVVKDDLMFLNSEFQDTLPLVRACTGCFPAHTRSSVVIEVEVQ